MPRRPATVHQRCALRFNQPRPPGTDAENHVRAAAARARAIRPAAAAAAAATSRPRRHHLAAAAAAASHAQPARVARRVARQRPRPRNPPAQPLVCSPPRGPGVLRLPRRHAQRVPPPAQDAAGVLRREPASAAAAALHVAPRLAALAALLLRLPRLCRCLRPAHRAVLRLVLRRPRPGLDHLRRRHHHLGRAHVSRVCHPHPAPHQEGALLPPPRHPVTVVLRHDHLGERHHHHRRHGPVCRRQRPAHRLAESPVHACPGHPVLSGRCHGPDYALQRHGVEGAVPHQFDGERRAGT